MIAASLDPVGIGIIVVAVVGGVLIVALVLRALRRSLETDAIWMTGRAERGRILSIRETGRALGRPSDRSSEVALELELESSKARCEVRFFPRHGTSERLHKGAVLDLRIAEDDPTRIAVDPTLRLL
jgi:hypothetical protein